MSELDDLRAENERLRAKVKELTEYYGWCGDCGEARSDSPRCTVCTIEYVPRQARALDPTPESQICKCPQNFDEEDGREIHRIECHMHPWHHLETCGGKS